MEPSTTRPTTPRPRVPQTSASAAAAASSSTRHGRLPAGVAAVARSPASAASAAPSSASSRERSSVWRAISTMPARITSLGSAIRAIAPDSGVGGSGCTLATIASAPANSAPAVATAARAHSEPS